MYRESPQSRGAYRNLVRIFICRPYDQFDLSPWSTIDEQTRALGLHVRVSMRLGGALVVVWVALLAIQASGDNASLPACEGVYMNQKAGSGFGNHFDGLTDLASVALACGLPMAIESAGLLDAICSRLRCANATRLPSSQNRRQLALATNVVVGRQEKAQWRNGDVSIGQLASTSEEATDQSHCAWTLSELVLGSRRACRGECLLDLGGAWGPCGGATGATRRVGVASRG